MQYPPTPQRKSCDCSDPCISTDDVYYAGPNLPNSGVNTSDLLTEVIEKLDAIYAVPTLQRVTEMGNYTTLPIIADSFVKIGGDGTNLLLDDGTVLPIGDLPAGVTETSQLINDGEDGIHPFITALDIPAFNPSDYDLDEFTNTGIDPFAHVSDIPAAPGLQEVLDVNNSSIDTQILLNSSIVSSFPIGTILQPSLVTINGRTDWYGEDQAASAVFSDATIMFKRSSYYNNFILYPVSNVNNNFRAPDKSVSGTYTLATLDDIPAPLGYVPVNKAGDTMLGILTLSENPIEPLDAVTKQYVDRIEEHTYAEYVALINDNALLPERYYALTDYQHKYYIEETNTSPKKVFGAVSDISVNYWIIDGAYHYDLNVGMVVRIESLPIGYTGSLVVGQTTTVTTAYANFYYRFANGMSYQYDAVGVGLSWSYTRYVTNTSLNNATVYDTHGKIEMKPGGVLNTDVHDGTAYGNLTAAQNFTPPIEKIILRAKSINSFYQSCASLTFLNDEMIYDFNDNIVYNDNEEQIGTRNGFISRRFNKVLEIDIDKDWRVQRYRRWLVPPATVESDYRKKLINQDYPNTNIYLAFQNKYLFTSEFMTTSSVDNMYICTSPEYSTLTAGETGSTVSYPITVTGSTGGVGSTEDIVNFKDYTIFELDSNLNPVEISKCEINQFKNSVFINTDATNKNDLIISINSSINDSTFFGYPYIVGKTTSLTKINAFDRIVIYGDYSTFQNINFLGFGEIISNTDYYKNLIFGSLPYYVWFSGMGPTSPESGTGTGVRWYVTISSTSSLQNCLIGVGYSTFTILNSKISGGSIFNYATKATILGIVEPSYLIVNTELTNANYHNYYAQNLTTDNVALTSKLVKISQLLVTAGIPEVTLRIDSASALYYQNLNIAIYGNTVTKNYNFTTFLFETVANPGNNILVVERTSGYTLTNADSGGIIIFKTTAAQTLTIPTGLADGFECTFVTLSGVTLTVTSTGNTLNNAIGNVLPSQSSFTLKRMIAANTFIATGNI